MNSYGKTKWVLTLLTLVFTISTAFAQKDGKPYQTKEFNVRETGNLVVETSGGSIDVSAHQSNTVRVEMYVRKNSRWIRPDDDDAREIMEDFKIDISQSGSTVYAKAERDGSISGWFGSSASVSFTVYVPNKTSCDLNTSGGSIRLSGVTGTQDVKTSGGSLNLKDLTGSVEAKTSGGSIKVDQYAGMLHAQTSGGSIHLTDARGTLQVHTSGGSIHLENTGGSIEASTSGGGIHAKVSGLEKYLRLKTSGGSITASIPGGLGLDLDLRGNRVNTKLVNFNGEAEKDRIRGKMNGGGIEVVMSTSGGSVNLDYQ